ELISSDRNNAEAFVMRGKCYEQRSQYKSAVEDLRSANQIKRNDNEIKEYLSKLENLWISDINDNIIVLEKKIALNPKLYENYISLAELYFEKGDKAKAESLYDEYLRNRQATPEAILRYGEILAKNNQLRKGEATFKRYSELYPQDNLILSRYGYFNLWMGNFSKAEGIFSDVLRRNPNIVEAQDGFRQSKAKGYFDPSNQESKKVVSTNVLNSSQNKIEQYRTKLSTNPTDYSSRLLMVNELSKSKRFEESFDQLQIVLNDSVNVPRNLSFRRPLIAKRDSLLKIIIDDYKDKIAQNPRDKNYATRIAYYYGTVNDYNNAMLSLSNYFNQDNITDGDELKYQYAQYASWTGEFDKALNQLDYLLSDDPGNLEYQALKGKILIWNNQNPELAEKYLMNNISSGNQTLEIILSLATLYIQTDNSSKADKFLEWARTLDSRNPEVLKVQDLYTKYKESKREQLIYSLIEEGREFSRLGECENAIIKFDEYFDAVKNPTNSELLEYADLQICVKNNVKAIEIYNNILSKKYDYDVALLRAKQILWKGDYKTALNEFQKLSSENPDNQETTVLLGEAYQNLQQYSMANSIYDKVLETTKDEKIIEMVNDRMSLMPQTGFSSYFSNFPSPIGFSPSFLAYSDNQDFTITNIGGRLEIGIATMVSGGVSYSDVNIYSSIDKRKFTQFKAHLFVNILDNLRLSGGYGTLNSLYLPKKNIGDVSLNFNLNQDFSVSLYYERNDAAMVLYSPYLVNFRNDVDLVKISGLYEQSKKLRLSGYFSYISISDGNVGNDFQLRIGSQLLNDTYFGYESKYMSYKYDSPFVPFTNQQTRLYYSPQNLDSHSLWAEWGLEQNEKLNFTFGGKLGYIPLYDVVLRELNGNLKYSPFSNLILNMEFSAGSSYRFDSSYNYFSGSLSLYWQLY
ncbi:MAG: tetratricopeptide repeat protein, partial [Melioribacteraceae bacterium]|nr:tetratricopeptide repeat protein [Melioribacteraceae bacterium]